MQERRVVWSIAGVLLVCGANWLVAMIWTQSALPGVRYAPTLLGSALAGLTLARVLDRRPVLLATTSALLWVALQAVVFVARGNRPPWTPPFDSAVTYYGITATLSVLAAAAMSSLVLRGRRDHRLLWLWISLLLTCGTLITALLLVAEGRMIRGAAIALVIAAPILAGGLTQLLAPARMIWICGGGCVVFVLVAIDQGLREHEAPVLGPILGVGVFIVLGALGARIAWRLFRNAEPRTPPARAELPEATTRAP